jgi:hypothetical protein
MESCQAAAPWRRAGSASSASSAASPEPPLEQEDDLVRRQEDQVAVESPRPGQTEARARRARAPASWGVRLDRDDDRGTPHGGAAELERCDPLGDLRDQVRMTEASTRIAVRPGSRGGSSARRRAPSCPRPAPPGRGRRGRRGDPRRDVRDGLRAVADAVEPKRPLQQRELPRPLGQFALTPDDRVADTHVHHRRSRAPAPASGWTPTPIRGSPQPGQPTPRWRHKERRSPARSQRGRQRSCRVVTGVLVAPPYQSPATCWSPPACW